MTGEPDDLSEALDALEGMVEQFFHFHSPLDGTLRHSFMSCEEYAVEVLCSLRPERWEAVGRSGIRRVPEQP